jgi:hypothetical protein
MNVEFWDVEALAATSLPMTASDVSAHLVADWIPSLPAAVGSSFIGWPPFLIEALDYQGKELLILREETRRSERQWKSVLSWMLGIAGTRHFLANDNYRWIAPSSAFYPEAIQEVDLALWHPSFPRTSIEVTRDPKNPSRLRPDYLALRSTASGGSYEWAVVEAKGTDALLTNLTNCPTQWRQQVQNAVVTVDGSEIAIQRRLVVATRVNPNAVRGTTRRIQVRAWNRQNPVKKSLPPSAIVELVSAHLFGLFRGLHLPYNALAIANSLRVRYAQLVNKPPPDETKTKAILREAESELEQLTRPAGPLQIDRVVTMQTELGVVEVHIADPLIKLLRSLQSERDVQRAATVVRRADALLDQWRQRSARHRNGGRTVILPFGVWVNFPQEFGR